MFLDPRQQPEGSYKIVSVRLSIRPSINPSVQAFSWNCIISFFLNFGMVLETHMKLCVTELDFLEKFFWPKCWENGPKMGQKQGFLKLLKDLVIKFYWICSIMKTYIIRCVPAQVPYLGKILFLRYGPKYSQSIRLKDFLINHLQNKPMK